MAKHRKVHLFDINIPGRQVFKVSHTTSAAVQWLTYDQESDSLTGGDKLTTFTAPFGKIGLGICYDIRFPEMAMVAARQGVSNPKGTFMANT